MNINNFTFIVTDDCNFNCEYCYQVKEKKYISKELIEKGVDFFYPYFINNGKVNVNFFGGEPLLAYEQIQHGVELIEKKNSEGKKDIEFQVTTNGSLLDEKKLEYLDEHGFFILLSFDGLAQTIDRKKIKPEKMLSLIKRIQDCPHIGFEVNSVFTPRTVDKLCDSMIYIIEQAGAPDVTFNVTTMEDWPGNTLNVFEREIERLGAYLVNYYKQKGTIPVTNFKSAIEENREEKYKDQNEREKAGESNKKPRRFRCKAGENRMAISPEGKVWGCFQFHDYIKNKQDDPQYEDFSFGHLDDFIRHYNERYPQILPNYSELRQDFFQVGEKFCFLCEYMDGCVICPVSAAYSSGSIGKISKRQCELVKLQRRFLYKFKQALKELGE